MTTRTRVAKVTNLTILKEVVNETKQFAAFLTAKNPNNPVYCVALTRKTKNNPDYVDVYLQTHM